MCTTADPCAPRAASAKAQKDEKAKGPRLVKPPPLSDFQFYDMKRIDELYAIEHRHVTWEFQQAHRRQELEKSNATPEEVDAELNKCVLVASAMARVRAV